MPGYPFVVLPHPVTSLSVEEATALADVATPYVEALLVDGIPRPANGEVAVEGSPQAPPNGVETMIHRLTEELALPLRADGADLSASHSGPTELTFSLHTTGATCEECVMPGEHLLAIFRRQTHNVLGPSWTVRLEDPREWTRYSPNPGERA